MMTRTDADRLIRGFADLTILVVGDLMLDRYVEGSVERISPEAPVPVLRVLREHSRPGGAANVALNVRALGGRAVVAGVVGRDRAGEELLDTLRENGIATEAVRVLDGLRTTTKTRVVAERQQVVRVDREDPPEALASAMGEFLTTVAQWAGRVSGTILEDYGKGVLTQPVAEAALRAGLAAGTPVGFDPKDDHPLRLSGLTFATPNYKEACAAAGQPYRPLDGVTPDHPGLNRLADALDGVWNARFLMITLGAMGMFVRERDAAPEVIPARAREVFDVCGAGDTVIATTALVLAAGASFRQAAMLANRAAGVVVGKIGTAPCHAAELLDALT